MDPVNASDLVNATVNATTTASSPEGAMIASVALFLSAVIPIYIGSVLSTKFKDKLTLEVVSSHDAMLFPLVASSALFGMFVLFKIIPREYINILVNIHFSVIGMSSLASLLCKPLRCCFPKSLKTHLFKLEFSSSRKKVEEETCDEWIVEKKNSIELQNRDLPGLALAIMIGIWYFATRHWISNNLVALTFCILAIEFIRLNKFINGCLLLGGLFFYDVFWVFGTPVMVSVAKNLDAPIKVTFPRDVLEHGVFGKELALLGLGDIVIPGIFVAMLLRFDISLNRNGSRSYFYTGYFAYIVGLLSTFVVMHTFKAAQPALLYLVPTCLGFPLGLALIKGDLRRMFDYEDVPETESKPEDKKQLKAE